MSLDEQAILEANAEFYSAFARHDYAAMDALWATATPVACVHPGWEALHGREQVMASWRAILLGPEPPVIRCTRPTAHRSGDCAFVVCVEEVAGGALAATNVFVREGAAWRLVHHHAGPIARSAAGESPPSGLLN